MRKINGNSNNVGVNGDVNINTERELQEKDKQPLLVFIEKVKKDNNTNTNCITVWSTSNTNSQKIIPQIIDFLKTQGYSVKPEGIKFFVPSLNGIDVTYKNSCIEISIGSL